MIPRLTASALLLAALALSACDASAPPRATAPGVPTDAYYQDVAEDAAQEALEGVDPSDFDALTES
jgi:ABC-type sugar transport system substrate-binding protein